MNRTNPADPFTVKVRFEGETKRVMLSPRMAASLFDQLVMKTCQRFEGNSRFDSKRQPTTFYYLDEENEIISISSQQDLQEALQCDNFATMKLVVAKSTEDANKEFCAQLEESAQISSKDAFSDFEKVSARDFVLGNSQKQSLLNLDLNKIEQQMPQTARNPPLADKIELSTSIVVADMKDEQIDFAPKDKQADEEPVVVEKSIEIAKDVKEAQKEADLAAQESLAVHMRNIDEACKEAELARELFAATACEKVEEKPVEADVLCFKAPPIEKEEQKSEDLDQMIKAQLKEYCADHFKELFKEVLDEKRQAQAQVVHKDVLCDSCHQGPIIGVRYKCSVCADFDLCEKCEMVVRAHPEHAMLKIRDPSQAPAQIICQYGNVASKTWSKNYQNMDFFQCLKKKSAQNNGGFPKKFDPKRFSARFVKENMADKSEVQTSKAFTKTWTLRNDGNTSWPAGTTLRQTSGDNLGPNPHFVITHVVRPSDDVEVSCDFVAPEKEGRYTTFFRLMTDNRTRFGQKLTCDVVAVDPEVIISEPKVSFEEPKKVKQPLDFSIDQKLTPKMVYYSQVNSLGCVQQMKRNLRQLFDCGFTNFEVNRGLLAKHHQDLGKVVDVLLSGDIGESVFPLIGGQKEE